MFPPFFICMFVCLCVCPSQSFLGKIQHRLLSAAEAAKMAVIYSQYASLYVLTNVVSVASLTSLTYSGAGRATQPFACRKTGQFACMWDDVQWANPELWTVQNSLP